MKNIIYLLALTFFVGCTESQTGILNAKYRITGVETYDGDIDELERKCTYYAEEIYEEVGSIVSPDYISFEADCGKLAIGNTFSFAIIPDNTKENPGNETGGAIQNTIENNFNPTIIITPDTKAANCLTCAPFKAKLLEQRFSDNYPGKGSSYSSLPWYY